MWVPEACLQPSASVAVVLVPVSASASECQCQGSLTDERGGGLPAALGDAGHDGARHAHVERAAREVVEEGERRGAVAQQVVDAHGHEVDADGVVVADALRHLQLRAHAVRSQHQHRLLRDDQYYITEQSLPREI